MSKHKKSSKKTSEPKDTMTMLNLNMMEPYKFYCLKKIEKLIEQMQDRETGIPVRTAKNFMKKIPTVFSGSSLITWLSTNLQTDEPNEALHLAHFISAHGYVFPVADHVLTVKNDLTYYRFQTPFFWPSNCSEPDNYDYAVYLCKRTMQNKRRLELYDFEAEKLARLQKIYCRKWEFIFLQAEAEAKVDKRRDRIERMVLDSQEQAYWDLHRPPPGVSNILEMDIRKVPKANDRTNHSKEESYEYKVERLKLEIDKLQRSIQRRKFKISAIAESNIQFFSQYYEYDPFITPPDAPNPWISDSIEFWRLQKSSYEISARRIKRWTFGLHELLRDETGRELFRIFLQKEFSAENLKFWEACENIKKLSIKEVKKAALDIYQEHLDKSAAEPVNLGGRVLEGIKLKILDNPDQYCLDEAQEHIYLLMRRDSYNRFVRLDLQKEINRHIGHKKSKKRFGSMKKFHDVNIKINFSNAIADDLIN